MKRARFNQGSVVFDKHIRKWRFLQWVNGKRRSRVIGTKQEFPTKTAAVRAAHSLETGCCSRSDSGRNGRAVQSGEDAYAT